MHPTTHRLPLAALLLTSALAWAPLGVAAQDTIIFQDVPTVDELNAVLFGKPADPATPPIKTRAIHFHGAAAATPPPASVPAQVPAQAAPPVEAAVASTAPVAPAPPPPAGTALGMNILFEYNSTNVLAESVPYLERLGEVLNLPENQGKVINIIGYTVPPAQRLPGLEKRAPPLAYLVDRLADLARAVSKPRSGREPAPGRHRSQ